MINEEKVKRLTYGLVKTINNFPEKITYKEIFCALKAAKECMIDDMFSMENILDEFSAELGIPKGEKSHGE